MKVCCDSGKPYADQTDVDKLSCNHDHCVGPIEVEDLDVRDNIDLLLTGIGTFDISDCISHEDMRHLFKVKKKDETTGD